MSGFGRYCALGLITTLGLPTVTSAAVFIWEGMEFIPDVDPNGVVVEIMVPGDGGPVIIDDLDVDVIIEHTWQGDIVVELFHINSGMSAQLMNRPGDPEFPNGFAMPNLGSPFTFEEFFFDDEAALPYDFPFVDFPGIPEVSGAWQPDGDPLSIFDGLDATGLWQLKVSDQGGGGGGFLRRFSLHITEPCQAPTFTQAPQSQSLCVGDTLIIDASVSGTGPFTYDWCFEDICGFIPSVPTLQIDDIALNEGGTYSVEVFGACGVVGSGAIQIDVTQRCHTEPPQCPPAAPHDTCRCMSDVNDIYLFSGEFHSSVVDLKIPGRGMDFVWARKYRSQVDTGFNRFANQWDFSYDIRIQPQGNSFLIWDGNTRKDHFTLQPDGTWKSDEFFRLLEQNQDCSRAENNNCYALTFEDSSQWRFFGFDSLFVFQLESIVDRNGNTMLFDYHQTFGTLVKVTDTLGREINIAYNADGKIESVTDWAARQVVYEYYSDPDVGGSAGDLKSVTTPQVAEPDPEFTVPAGHEYPGGKTTVYTYTEDFPDDRLNHNLLTITDPKGQTYLVNEYDPTPNPADLNFDRLVRQTLGQADEVIDFVYLPQMPDAGNNFAVIKTIVNDRVGNVSAHFHDELNRLVIKQEFSGRADPDQPTTESTNLPVNPLRPDDPPFFETRYEWNEDSMCIRVQLPNGNEILKTFDSNNDSQRSQGNMLQACIEPGDLGGDQDMICELFEYDDDFGGCCGSNFVTRHTDARGNDTLHQYDANGNRTHTQHRIPSIVEDFEYNPFGQLTLQVQPDNGSAHRRRDAFSYYDSGPQLGYRSAQIIDEDGFALTTTYEYDIVGNMTRITDPRMHDTQYDVNQLNQVLRERSREVTDGSGVRYEKETFYDPNDNVIRIDIPNIDDNGIEVPGNPELTTTYEYDILNYMTRRTQEVGPTDDIVTELEYDDNRNPTLERQGEATNGNDPLNIIRTLYDERDLVFQMIRAEGSADQSTTQTDYDGNKNVKAVREGLEDVPRVTLNTYDGYDRLFVSMDPMGNATEFHYDPNGNPGGDVDPQGQPGVPNPFGKRIAGELIDIEGDTDNDRLYEVTYEYDLMNRMTRQVTEFFDTETQAPIPGGQQGGKSITDITYSDNSQPTSKTNDNNHSILTVYDTANRVLTVTDAKSNSKTRQYDPNSNLIVEIELDKSDLLDPDQEFTTTYEYDNLDRLTRSTDNLGNATTRKYDSRDNPTRDIDALDLETRYEYDGINRMTRIIYDMDSDGADGDGADIVNIKAFDDSSRLIHEQDDNNNITIYSYDSLNRITVASYADNTTRDYIWDVHDNKTEESDANGSATTNTYDLLNRLIVRTVDRASVGGGDPIDVLGTTSEFFSYDGLSRVVSAADDDSEVTLSYDSLSNATLETLNSQTTSSTYDGVGNKLSCVYPGGRQIQCTYDALERKKTIVDVGSGLTLAAYSYVGPLRVEQSVFGNGTRADITYDGITGIPNPAGDFGVKKIITTTHSRIIDGAIIDARTYTWNKTYHKTQRQDIRSEGPELTHEYVYDPIYRLTRTIVTDSTAAVVRDTTYDLDGVGNREEVIGEPNPGLYIMDPGGDLQMNRYTSTPFEARDHDPNGNLILQDADAMIYDYRDQMVEFADAGLGQLHGYTYDAFGRRIERLVDAGGGGPVLRYFYDGYQVVEEQNELAETVATYVYGSYIDEVLTMQRDTDNDGQAEDFFYHSDDLYNVIALTRDSSIGNQWSDNLDSYAAGPLSGMGGWEPWDLNPAAGNFEVTPDQARSEPHSVAVDGADDAVRLYAGFDSGISIYSAWQYIPTDFVAGSDFGPTGTYFLLLNTYTPGGPYHWSVQMQFDSTDGLCKVWQGDGNNTINVPYETDRWVKIQVAIDLDNDWTQVYYDDQLVTEYPWTGGVLGDGGGALDIAVVDLFANGSSPVYYDDLHLERFDEGLPGTVAERYDYGDFGLPEFFHCPSDQTGDGQTTSADLAQLLGAWGPNPGHPSDLNNDGVVDAVDLAQMLGSWGTCQEPTPIGNPYLFNGRRFDEETELYFYRSRYMEPQAGRFTTRDPIGIWGDGGNLGNGYTYVGNDPLSALDPFGLQSRPRRGDMWQVLADMAARAQARWEALPAHLKFSMCAGFTPKTGWAHFVAYYLDPDQTYRMCYNRWQRGQLPPAGPAGPTTPPRPSGPSHFSGSCMARCLAASGVQPGDRGPKRHMNALIAACRKKCSKPKGPTGPTGPTTPSGPPTRPGGPCQPSGGTTPGGGLKGDPSGPTEPGAMGPFDDPHWNDPLPSGPTRLPLGQGWEPGYGPRRLPLGQGKMAGYACLDQSCQVVTRAGLRRIGDIRIGDEVLTPAGEFRRVVEKDFGRVWEQRLGDYVEIKTTKASIILTRDHVIGARPAGAWRDGEHMTMHNGDVLAVTVRPAGSQVSGDLRLEGDADYVTSAGFVIGSMISRYRSSPDLVAEPRSQFARE